MSFSMFIKKYNINRDFVLFTLIVMGICFLYNEKVYNAKQKILKQKSESVKLLTEEIKKLGGSVSGSIEEKSANLEKLKVRHKALEREQAALFARFPNKAEASKMLEEVVSDKKGAGIIFESFYPSDEMPTEYGYNYIPIEVVVTGSFNKLGDYIKYIENLPRIFIIDDIIFQVSKEESRSKSSTAKLKGRTFVLK